MLAIRAATIQGFTGPFVCFDDNDFQNIHRAYGFIPCEAGSARRLGSVEYWDPSTGRTAELTVFKGGAHGSAFAIESTEIDCSSDPGAVRDPVTGQRLMLINRTSITVLVAGKSYFLDLDFADGEYTVAVPTFMAEANSSFTDRDDALSYFNEIQAFLTLWVDFQSVPRTEVSGTSVIANAWYSFQDGTTESEIIDWFSDRYGLSKELTLFNLPNFELITPGPFTE